MKEDTKDNKETPRKPRTYVLDTSALLEDPDIMYKLNGIIVIPLAVIKELDGLKKSDDPNYHVAMAARKVARTLDNFGSYADLEKGVKLSTGGVLAITAAHDDVDGLASEADNKIVGTAVKLKRAGHNVTLLTTDGNMRTVARVSGVKGEMPLGGEGASVLEFNDREVFNDKKNIYAKNKFLISVITFFWIEALLIFLLSSFFAFWDSAPFLKALLNLFFNTGIMIAMAIIVTPLAILFTRIVLKKTIITKETGDYFIGIGFFR